jgi:DNA replication protein DnaC
LLTHPTLDQLHALGLHGMAKAFVDIEAAGDAKSLGHAEWLALLLEREASLRRDKRLTARLRYAKLRQQACVEDIDYRTPRGLQSVSQHLPETLAGPPPRFLISGDQFVRNIAHWLKPPTGKR